MKKAVLLVLKIVVPLAIIAWLLSRIDRELWSELAQQPKNWSELLLAFVCYLSAVCLTFLRWRLLVRALGMPFRFRDALRLGFLGYLFNFVSFGSIGGDLFKAVFLAHEQPGRRAEAVATVVVDRVIGLFGMLVVASIAVLGLNIPEPVPAVTVVRQTTFVATAIGAVAFALVMTPGFSSLPAAEFVTGLPKVGPTLARLIAAVRMYRARRGRIVLILLLSLVVHVMITTSVWLCSDAVFQNVPTLKEDFVIVPLSGVAAGLPFTPAGLGAFELAMEKLFLWIPEPPRNEVRGVLVALIYRLGTIGVAMVGVVFYWSCRREVRQLISEAEQLERDEQAAG